MTSQTDGCAHQVTDEAFASGLAQGEGTYQALCGHAVVALPMICEDGPECLSCAMYERARPPAEPLPRRVRHPLLRLHRKRAAMDG